MRKGYMLLEMIAILGLLAIFFLLMTEPMRILLSDVSRGHRDFQTAASLNHLFDRLKTDIEAAKEVKTTDDPNTLMVIANTGTTLYRFTEERIYRIADDNPDSADIWTLPHTHLVWNVKNQNSLQITGWLEKTVLSKTEKKFHNSHLFYAKGFESGEVQ